MQTIFYMILNFRRASGVDPFLSTAHDSFRYMEQMHQKGHFGEALRHSNTGISLHFPSIIYLSLIFP